MNLGSVHVPSSSAFHFIPTLYNMFFQNIFSSPFLSQLKTIYNNMLQMLLLPYLFRQYWCRWQALSYTMMLGALVNLVENIVKGTCGLSCDFILSNPRQIPCSQNKVKMPGDNVGWPRENFLHLSSPALQAVAVALFFLAYLPGLKNKWKQRLRNNKNKGENDEQTKSIGIS